MRSVPGSPVASWRPCLKEDQQWCARIVGLLPDLLWASRGLILLGWIESNRALDGLI